MKIKSLLIGSAAVMAVSTGGAKAADAIVMAEPEPMEYVRICDVYGTGFFYIPGTETCLKIGGYVRYETRYIGYGANTWANGALFDTGAAATGAVPNYFYTRTRFTPKFDARSETEIGTLRAYAEIEMNYESITVLNPTGTALALGGTQYFNIAHAFIEINSANGVLRIGRTHTPFARFLGYGPGGFTFDGAYGYSNRDEISYTFNGSNGFSAILAVVEDAGDTDWVPDVEGGFNLAQGWGSFGVIAGYDESTATWGVRGALRFSAPNSGISGGLHVFYSSGAGAGRQYAASTTTTANWSVLGHATFQFTPKVAANVMAQWFDTGAWDIGASLALTPAEGLLIRPEIHYLTGPGAWLGVVRFQRDF